MALRNSWKKLRLNQIKTSYLAVRNITLSLNRTTDNNNVHNNSVNSISKSKASQVLYDGDCKICQIEISALKRLTRRKGGVEFVDISRPDYDSGQWRDVSYEDAMKEMHVIGPDGTVHMRGDAIRQMYRACGLGWLASLTELPVIRPVCDDLYVRFARYRLQKALGRCDSDSCDIKLKQLRDKLEDDKSIRS